jgi:hypothetical protein
MSKNLIINQESLAALPRIREVEKQDDPTIHLKITHPSGARWHVAGATKTKHDTVLYVHANLGDDEMAEWGYQSLAELESLGSNLGVGCRLDPDWTPRRVSELKL